MANEAELFRAFHRRRLLVASLSRMAVVAGAAALVIALLQVVAAAPEPGFDAVSVAEAQVPGAPVNAAQETLPQPTSTTTAVPQAPELLPVTAEGDSATTLERSWTIDVDTVGYQTELDACLWVRMDLGAAAPIVGAHNFCGGGIVLQMGKGDTVTLTGTSLDGVYEVVDARDASAGDSAAGATEGMIADVILQTCYWENNGRALLIALVRSS
jgi:hypothetical protein